MLTSLRRLSHTGEGRQRQIAHTAAKLSTRRRAPHSAHHRSRTDVPDPQLRDPHQRDTSEELSAWVGFLPMMVQQQIVEQAGEACADATDSERDELAEGGDGEAATLPPPREMLAAAIFADASGFTALTERLSRLPDGAERMCGIMNNFLGRAVTIIHQHGGQIIKFAGGECHASRRAVAPRRHTGLACF